MSRYIATRVILIFIMLVMILTVNFTLLKLAPAYPPTTVDERNIYFNKQVADGYMKFRLIEDPEEMEEIRAVIASGKKPEALFMKTREVL